MRQFILLTLLVVISLYPAEVFSLTSEEYVSRLVRLLNEGDSLEKQVTLHKLYFRYKDKYKKDRTVFDPIIHALDDSDPGVREAAAATLKRILDHSHACCKDSQIVPSLISTLNDKSARVRAEAAAALGYSADARAVAPLVRLFNDSDLWVRLNAVQSIGLFGGSKRHVSVPLTSAGTGKIPLKKFTSENAYTQLIALLSDDSEWQYTLVRQECIIALKKMWIPEKKIIPEILKYYNDPYLKMSVIKTFITYRAAVPKRMFLDALKPENEEMMKVAEQLSRKLPTEVLSLNDREYLIDTLLTSSGTGSVSVRELSLQMLNRFFDLSTTKQRERVLRKALVLTKENSNGLKALSLRLLNKFRDSNIAMDALLGALVGDNGIVNKTALNILSTYGDEIILEKFAALLRLPLYGKKSEEISSAFMRVGRKHKERAVDLLIEASTDPDPAVRLKVAKLIYKFDDERVRPLLINFINDTHPPVRAQSINNLTNMENPETVPEIITALQDTDHKVRRSAARYLGLSHDKNIIRPLLEVLTDKYPEVRREALHALSRFNAPAITESSIQLLNDRDERVRHFALQILIKNPDSRAVPGLLELLDSKSWSNVNNSVKALGAIGDSKAVESVIKILNDDFHEKINTGIRNIIRASAADALGNIGDKRAVPHLIELLDNKNMVEPAIKALGSIKSQNAIPALTGIFQDAKPHIQYKILNVLARLGDPGTLEIMVKATGKIKTHARALMPLGEHNNPLIMEGLVKYLEDDDKVMRIGAIRILGKLRDRTALAQLNALLQDDDPEIQTTANKAVNEISAYRPAIKTTANAVKGGYDARSAIEFGPQKFKPTKKTIKRHQVKAIAGKENVNRNKKPVKQQKPRTVDNISLYTIPETAHDLDVLYAYLNSDDAKQRRKAVDRLGDIGDNEAGRLIVPLLQDRDPFVRQAASRSSGKLKSEESVSSLIINLNDSDAYVRAYAAWALGEIGEEQAVKPLIDTLSDKDHKVREWSKSSLIKLKIAPPSFDVLLIIFRSAFYKKDYVTVSKLLKVLTTKDILYGFKDPMDDDKKTIDNYITLIESNYYDLVKIGKSGLIDYENRSLVINEISSLIKTQEKINDNTVSVLRHLNDPEAIPAFIHILENRANFSISSKRNAVDLLTALQHKEASGLLLELLMDSKEFEGVRSSAAKSLGNLDVKEAGKVMINILQKKEEHKEVRKGAAMALGDMKDKAAVQTLITVLRDNTEDVWLRVASVNSLANIGNEESVAALREFSNDPSNYVNNAVQTALRKF